MSPFADPKASKIALCMMADLLLSRAESCNQITCALDVLWPYRVVLSGIHGLIRRWIGRHLSPWQRHDRTSYHSSMLCAGAA